ncbi:MAG: GGDEF domain-containing protein [Geodermatophilaceae bacterium]|nr:GGDEF domain-containing protein [Geodermatophilaceae bacterium]
MHDRRPEVIELLRQAQSGATDRALAGVEAALLRIADEGASAGEDIRPALLYVRGIAYHCLGDHRAAAIVAEHLTQAARSAGNAAWLCIGQLLALLQKIAAEPTSDLSPGDAMLQDLAAAEADLPGPDGEPLAAVTAYAGIGRCYMILRLYEFAQPHFEAAVDVIAVNPQLLRVSAVTMQLNLAELHACWAMELRRVDRVAEAAEQEAAALRHALLAEGQPALEETDAYRAKGSLLAACLSVHDGDPLHAAQRIRDCSARLVGRGQRSDESFARLYEARALARAHRLPEALDAARQACSALPTDAPPALTAAALHCRAQLVVQVASDGEIMAYGDYLALVLADQRERTLDLARSVQLLERLRRERERIQQLAYTDALTGVGNRHAFHRYVEELAGGPEDAVGVAVIDVDDLKLANDWRGHEAGDEILRVIAASLMSRAGPRDFVARLGGDEFVFVSLRRPGPDFGAVGDEIASSVASALHGRASVSVGVADGRAGDVVGLLHSADLAMYEAKRAGRAGRAGRAVPAASTPSSGAHGRVEVERV